MTNSVLGVRNIQHTNGTDAMTIASDGLVTFNNPPNPIGFCVHKSGNQSITANDTKIESWATTMRGGFNTDGSSGTMIDLSTGIVTIPADGYYQMNINIRLDSFSGTYAYFDITEITSGSMQTQLADRLGRTLAGNISSNYEMFTYAYVGYLTEDFTFALWYRNSGDNNVTIDGDTYWSMFKVG
jgi:hypothetical protein